MKTLSDFTLNEKRILDSILQKGIVASKTGFVSKLPQEGKQAGGYIICIRYDDEANSNIEKTSKLIKRNSGGNAIVFGRKNAHQTISDFDLQEYNEGMFVPDEEILKSLSRIACKSFNKYKQVSNQEPLTVFGNYIPSDDSVIQRPIDNLGNYELINFVKEESQSTDTPLKGTWGRHMTSSRFSQDLSPKQSREIGRFLFFDDYGLKQAFPSVSSDGDPYFAKSLDVCTLTATRKGFNLETYESFKF